MTTCKSCTRAHENPRDIWTCLWCPDDVCDGCYTDHTDTHMAIHSPYIVVKMKNEKCGATMGKKFPYRCTMSWGHLNKEQMHVDANTGAVWHNDIASFDD